MHLSSLKYFSEPIPNIKQCPHLALYICSEQNHDPCLRLTWNVITLWIYDHGLFLACMFQSDRVLASLSAVLRNGRCFHAAIVDAPATMVGSWCLVFSPLGDRREKATSLAAVLCSRGDSLRCRARWWQSLKIETNQGCEV